MAKSKSVIGAWAFLIGVLIAIIVGILGLLSGASANIWIIILAILGVIIGLLNIMGTEVEKFMIAGAVLVVVSAFGSQYLAEIPFFGGVIQALVIMFGITTIIVALKAVFSIARK